MNTKKTPPKAIALLGSTGSIGTQTLEVIQSQEGLYEVKVLTAQRNADLLIEQARQFRPEVVVIRDESQYLKVKEALPDVNVWAGEEALTEAAALPGVEMVLTALVGAVGLKPTIAAIRAGKDIALANKETLVVAGELIMALADKHQVKIIPVDSEHSAIFQCLVGEEANPLEKVILTASGGPFRGKTIAQLQDITKKEALRHPNWSMGAKITIDSASLMNKGLEAIEAKWLFHLAPSQVEVIIHPQSIIHSLVQFEDGSMKAQLGLPDMKLPIHYALAYPHRLRSTFERFDFSRYPQLNFEEPDTITFRNLSLAYQALEKGGNLPCILNAANEIAVEAFLQDRCGFLQMSDLIETCMAKMEFIQEPSIENYLESDRDTRIFAAELVTNNRI